MLLRFSRQEGEGQWTLWSQQRDRSLISSADTTLSDSLCGQKRDPKTQLDIYLLTARPQRNADGMLSVTF